MGWSEGFDKNIRDNIKVVTSDILEYDGMKRIIKDTVEAFIKITESDKTIGEVINAGSNHEISIGDLVNKIIKLSKKNVNIVCDDDRLRPEKIEVNRLWADNTKIKKLRN